MIEFDDSQGQVLKIVTKKLHVEKPNPVSMNEPLSYDIAQPKLRTLSENFCSESDSELNHSHADS